MRKFQICFMNKIIIATLLCTLFSCFNKKTDNFSETKSADSHFGSTKENISNSKYSVLQIQIDDKICFATINQSFKNFDNKNSFPLSLWVTVETKEKDESGHPLEIEATLFNKLKDELIDYFISKKMPFCYIGKTTRDGYRELMFYVSNEDQTTVLMNSFIKENKFNRKIEFAIDSDPTWESVSVFY